MVIEMRTLTVVIGVVRLAVAGLIVVMVVEVVAIGSDFSSNSGNNDIISRLLLVLNLATVIVAVVMELVKAVVVTG